MTGFGECHQTVARERENSDPPDHTIMQRQTAVRWCTLAVLLLAVILVPFVVYEESITAAVESYVRSDQPIVAIAFGIAALLASDVLLPVPSSLAATASGLLMGWPLGTLVTWMGYECWGIYRLLDRHDGRSPRRATVCWGQRASARRRVVRKMG